jgi:hypothetical protein
LVKMAEGKDQRTHSDGLRACSARSSVYRWSVARCFLAAACIYDNRTQSPGLVLRKDTVLQMCATS